MGQTLHRMREPTTPATPAPATDVSAPKAQTAAGEAETKADGQEKSKEKDTGEGQWIFADPAHRARKLETFYEVPDREMGRGHYGVVRKGTRRSDGARVAVKTIPKRRAVYVDMMRNEISILRSLQHANIIRLYDEFEDEKQVHLVFELCTGGELFEPIADQNFRFTEHQAARLVRKMLEAVKHCHDRNIVHRDLKPENMLLSAPGIENELKVIDFGLATHIKPNEMLGRHVGTPYYIAPEVLEKKYGKSCDMWSIGIVTFTLLCGFPPFWGDTEREIYARIRRGYYAFEGPDWQTRSPPSRDFIQRLLTSVKKRLTVDQALVHPWIVCEGDVIDARSKRMISKLKHYTSFPWLKRLALAVVAKAMSPQHAAYPREIFETFVLNEDHVITLPELIISLRQRGVSATKEEAAALLDGLDLNRDNVVTFTEFAAAVMPRLYYLNDRQICDVFAVLDVDHDGQISFSDLRHLVGDDSFAAVTLAESDIDGDGVVSFADFTAVLAGNEEYVL